MDVNKIIHHDVKQPLPLENKSVMEVISEVFNCDCMELMSRYPDKFFDLAVVDPPYGLDKRISQGGGSHTKSKATFHQLYSEKGKTWDEKIPPDEYFKELFRVSKNQIIWGGNYFRLPSCRGFIVWDKIRFVDSFSCLEYAWSSFDQHAKLFSYCNNAGFVLKERDYKIHPTQKPIALYDWVFKNYAKPGNKILDTHLGSQSSRIAAYKLGFDFWGCEIDTDYFNDGNERFKKAIAEPLFQTSPVVMQAKLL